MRAARPAVGILLLIPLSFAAAVYFGSVSFSAQEWSQLLQGQAPDTMRDILLQLRLPRAIAAFACGGLLALAGALLQALLRNPLADPYLLGVSGGASVGALSGMLLGMSTVATHGLSLLGASAAGLALLLFSCGPGGWQVHRVILSGVAIGAACGALVALILSLAPSGELHGMLFWLMGDLSTADNAWPAWIVFVLVLTLAQSLANALDAMVLGELKAASLGMPVRRTQFLAFAAATVATVAAVMLAGAIGFVGLVVPHLLRLAGINEHRLLLPLSAAGGGVLLVLADTASRSMAAPLEFPVGVMTALLGVPILLLLLARTR
ncbi:MAG TPA: iron ABC transporter permease [Burkholderiales bacterium]|nr:iron ABC transporter permease [Burkholderiales bacterium]